MRFWLVNSGTSADPMVSRPVARFRAWEAANGPVQGFSKRPARMAVDDVLIHRAVGTRGDRLIAVGIVTGPPVELAVERWTWRLPRRITHLCTSIEIAPQAAALDITVVRTFKELNDDTGRAARMAIETVADEWIVTGR